MESTYKMIQNAYNLSKQGDLAEFPLYWTRSFFKM